MKGSIQMPNLIYNAEPEKRLEGKWISCPPSEAKRWAVYRVLYRPKKRGQQRPAPSRRLLATFFGPNAEACARALVARSVAISKPRPAPKRRQTIARSLTQQQWLDAQQPADTDLEQE